MAGGDEDIGPMYISLRSAEVILSDIRPIKLKVESLRSVNVFLDELLFSILKAARSLTTEKLREGLLKVVPTALGKAALLEAEVELRAYWDRTSPSGPPASQGEEGKDFHLQWAFELLRLKCEGFSTLNDEDEDAEAEMRLHERMAQASGLAPPKATLVAPASLYLTAILEAICEHILSNVGRVAARDSSRTSATVHDLFVALCEDHSIYGLFKSMKVYEQIENLSSLPRSRRSKSVSRPHDRAPSISRTGSPSQEILPHHRASPPAPARSRSRISSESSGGMTTTTTIGVTSTSRSSFEKSRAMKMFANNSRSSIDHGNVGGLSEGHGSHKKSESILSDGTRQTLSVNDVHTPATSIDFGDEVMAEEFDNAMRSSSTMKVSLTPDRLKTMEVYNKEKNERGSTRQSPTKPTSRTPSRPIDHKAFDASSASPSPEPPVKVNGAVPSLRHVDSIIEDEEDSHGSRPPVLNRPRQASAASATAKPSTVTRTRSISAANPPVTNRALLNRKPSQEVSFQTPQTPQKRERHIPKKLDTSAAGPPRTRTVARNRESLDLDEIMGASDDEAVVGTKGVSEPNKRRPPHAVSSSTRELMDFLATAPPEDPLQPKISSPSVLSFSSSKKSKTTGRLQRMISKLRLGDPMGDRQPSQTDESASPTLLSPMRPILVNKKSVGSIPLANRPIPPRPPPPISPPSSPSQVSLDEPVSSTASSRRPSQSRKTAPSERQTPSPQPPLPTARSDGPIREPPTMSAPLSAPPHANGQAGYALPKAEEKVTPSAPRTPRQSATDSRSSTSNALKLPSENAGAKRPTSAPTGNGHALLPSHPSAEDARDIRRLLSRATTADECRVLMDMFLAKCGLPSEPADYTNPYPSPASDNVRVRPSLDDDILEHSLVDLLLGDNPYATIPTVSQDGQDPSFLKNGPPPLASPPDTPNPQEE